MDIVITKNFFKRYENIQHWTRLKTKLSASPYERKIFYLSNSHDHGIKSLSLVVI